VNVRRYFFCNQFLRHLFESDLIRRKVEVHACPP
jgi:hypothetical protein